MSRPFTPAAVTGGRAESARDRAEVARQRAMSARRRAEDLQVRISALGAGLGQVASAAPAEVEVRPPGEGHVGDSFSRLMAEGQRLRAEAAQLSDCMAEEAEKFADHLEHNAARGDRELRLSMAETERRIAGIERRNAVRLRADPGRRTPLESLPDLPGFHTARLGPAGTEQDAPAVDGPKAVEAAD